MSEKRYPALRFISATYRLFAWASLACCIPVGAYLAMQAEKHIVSPWETRPDHSVALVAFAVPVIYGLVAFLVLLCASEVLRLFMDIERNTRLAAGAAAAEAPAGPGELVGS